MLIRPRRAVPALLAVAALGVSAPVAAAKTLNIEVGDDFFSPSSKTVKKGTKLKFKWTGKNTHNVRTTGAAKKESKFQKSGTFSFKAKKTGTIQLICDIHSDMRGSITVN